LHFSACTVKRLDDRETTVFVVLISEQVRHRAVATKNPTLSLSPVAPVFSQFQKVPSPRVAGEFEPLNTH
jgi:hypothetical protein